MARQPLVDRIAIAAAGLAMLSIAACGGAEARKATHIEKGNAFLAQDNFEKARVEYRNALQIAPNDADVRYDNGLVDEKLGNPREAAQFYQGSLDVNPDQQLARANLARLYLFSGASDRALELLRPGIEKHPDDARLLTIRAAARAQQKDLAGAMADAQRAVQLAPLSEDSNAVLAGLYTSTGKVAESEALLESAIKQIPATIDLRLALAQIYAGQNRQAETETLLLDLVRLEPAKTAHRIRLAQFYARQNQVDAAERALREAIKAIPEDRNLKLSLVDLLRERRGRDAAEKELRAMIAAAPSDQELQFALARFYEQGRAFALAEAIYHGIIDSQKLDAAGLSARDRLAELRVETGDVAGALKLADEVLAESPRDDDALILRGNIDLAQQDPKAAIADMRTVLRDQPNAIGVLRTLARAHMANGEPAIAEETLRNAVESNPKDVTLKLDFAQLLAQLGKPEQAEPIIGEVVKEDPENVAALDTEFRIAAQLQDYVTGQSAAAALVSIHPKAAIGYYFEGMIAEEQQRFEEALRLYGQAADLQPELPDPLQAQVKLLVKQRRIPQALARLDDLIRRFPTSAIAPNLKGEILLGERDFLGANAQFSAAIALAPKWWIPYRGLAFTQVAEKDPATAVATLRIGERSAAEPDSLGAELGALLERLGRPDEAMREYDAVIRRNPHSDVAINNLAMLLATYKKDVASLDRAKELASRFSESSNPSFLDTYGWVLYKRGEAAASVPVLEKVVAEIPDQAVARYHLGMAQSSIGSNAEARDNLTRAINSGVKFDGLEEAKATLNKLADASVSSVRAPHG